MDSSSSPASPSSSSSSSSPIPATDKLSTTNGASITTASQLNGSHHENNQIQNDDNQDKKINFIQKLWMYRKYFVIEPFLLCWLLPSCFHIIAVQNLGLEKACRVNLGYSKDICDNVIDKTINGIDCDALLPSDENNETLTDAIAANLLNDTAKLLLMTTNALLNATENVINNDSKAITNNLTPEYLSSQFNNSVCQAERETQKQVTFINGIRGPIASIFPIIVILFAGGWSDRKGVRKPCMIFPMLGEIFAVTALLISALFMETIPMEFGSILERVLPAMFGGQTLMIMGIYSYLTASTAEKDRTFRFGIFAIVANIIPIIGIPFSGTLYKQLGYIYVFLLSDVLFILGLLYMIFFVNEIKTPSSSLSETKTDTTSSELSGQENPAFELSETTNGSSKNHQQHNEHQQQQIQTSTTMNSSKKKNCLVEFFDPTLAYDCLKVFFKKRERNGRLYLILLVCSYFLFIGPTVGEADYQYQFCLIALNWDGEQFSLYSTYSTIIVTVGTFIITGIFSKMFHMSDSMVGLLSSICTVISRPMYAFSKASPLYYAATTVDLFVSAKAIAIKSIISSFVADEELGRIYSVMGITDAFDGFIFPPIYSYVYSSTIDNFPGAYYLFSDLFFIPTGLLFALTYFLLRNKSRSDDTNDKSAEEQGNIQSQSNAANETNFSDGTYKEILESTYM